MGLGNIVIFVAVFVGVFTSIYFLLTFLEIKKKNQLFLGESKRCPCVTICVPCYNEEKTVIKTLRSLCNLKYNKKQLEIIVVDDGSKDKTYVKAKAFAKANPSYDIKVFKKKNGGKYTALNFALKKSRGKFFGALDADSFVEEKALLRIMKLFENKDITAVTPSMKIFKPRGLLQRVQQVEYLFGIFLRKVFAGLGAIHVTPGPFSIYRKSFFDKYGGFTKAFHTEDIEMALRAQSHHKVIDNAIDAYVYTVGPNTWKGLWKQRIRWYVGFIKNIMIKPHLLSKKHGNLGLIMIPSSFISVFIASFILFYTSITFITNGTRSLINWAAINFSFFNFTFVPDPFFINTSTAAILGGISLLFGLVMILIAQQISGEKLRHLVWSYILFILTYWIFYALWWIVSFLHVIFTKKDLGWGHKSEYKNESKYSTFEKEKVKT
ncbi:MAG: glycosyltransferase [Candidatus Woesearchaeota archaeon]